MPQKELAERSPSSLILVTNSRVSHLKSYWSYIFYVQVSVLVSRLHPPILTVKYTDKRGGLDPSFGVIGLGTVKFNK